MVGMNKLLGFDLASPNSADSAMTTFPSVSQERVVLLINLRSVDPFTLLSVVLMNY